ncbi:hypothetical protein Ga0123461_0904 [Mariprofundus aestuarium]|uniref:Uncharacterized protein n=1 Tax=Mariprofundus aestuarium TaxID=1921086 RepID=A0A2K8L2Z0_MARES|nr:hypothetical protein [Mariprofundus aestuarium]ATX79324.1 hypothetical protein Ga0123461_0904 [Mariprofundus aestuarium]
MIKYQAEFEGYIRDIGVGPADKVAASVKSSVASLNSVSKHLGINIDTKTLGSNSDIDELAERLSKMGRISTKNIKHYRSAMLQYVNMVNGK